MTQAVAAALRSGARLRVQCGPMVHGGLCVAHVDAGWTILVAGAIPGEECDVELRYRKGRTWFADTVSATVPSPHRVTPPCRYVPECGGCQLQHIAYAEQLELKRGILIDALRRASVPLPAAIDVIGMEEPWRYRRRGEFHVVAGADGVRDAGLGFNRARSWRPIAVDDCLIHDSGITTALPLLRRLVRGGGRADLGTLHVTLGDGGDELLLRPKPRDALAAEAIDETAQHMQGRRLGTDSTSLTWRGHSYRVTPETFIQVNHAQMDALYGRVLGALGCVDGRRVVDAYAGIGILPVHLAAQGAWVTCIESNRAAARIGVLNARLNGVEDRVRYEHAPAEEALPRASGAPEVDALVLDPPRAGCGSSVTGWIALAGPDRVVYVSCDPATLARDLHVLAGSGPYSIDSLAIVDMFPQTYHVETVVALRRWGGERPLSAQ